MEDINEISAVLMALITVGTTARLTFCLVAMSSSENGDQYKTRMKNAVIFLVLANSFLGITNTILSYFN